CGRMANFYPQTIARCATLSGGKFQQVLRLAIQAGNGNRCRGRQFGIIRCAKRLDADDVAVATTVGEIPVHRIGQERALDETAELLDILAPVGDERWLSEQRDDLIITQIGGTLGVANESGDGGADGFNWLSA